MSRTYLNLDNLDRDKLYYLASPYTGHPYGLEVAYRETLRNLAQMLKQRAAIISPIVHAHEAALLEELPKDAGYWERMNHRLIDACDVVVVLMLGGWRLSEGVTAEIAYAVEQDKPVRYLVPTYTPNKGYTTVTKQLKPNSWNWPPKPLWIGHYSIGFAVGFILATALEWFFHH